MQIVILMFALFSLLIVDTRIKKRISGGIKVESEPKRKLDNGFRFVNITFIVIIFILNELNSTFNIEWLLLISIILSLMIDIYTDWKYGREAKKHIVSFFTYPLIIALIIGLFTFI